MATKSKSASTMPSKTTMLKVDYDVPGAMTKRFAYAVHDTIRDRLAWLAWQLGVEVRSFSTYMSHSGGLHAEAVISGDWPPVTVIAMQTILGSDPKRETFNLVRALTLDSAPAFWRKRWNVLYASKLGGADMINQNEYRKGKPTIKAAMFPGVEVVPLTLASVEQTELDGLPKLKLEFTEFPDHCYWPNVTSIDNLVKKLGNDETKWIGQKVPLVKTMQPNPQLKDKMVEVLWVADADDEYWDARRSRGGSSSPARAKAKARK